MSTNYICLIERAGIEGLGEDIVEASGDALLGSPDNPSDKKPYQLSIVAHERVIQSLQNRLDSHPFRSRNNLSVASMYWPAGGILLMRWS